MCKESVQLEILKRSEKKQKTKNKKKAPARSLFFLEIRKRNILLFFTWPYMYMF